MLYPALRGRTAGERDDHGPADQEDGGGGRDDQQLALASGERAHRFSVVG
jgi:hypothetical protein